MIKKVNLDTREKILKTAGRLFSQRGYFGVSMDEIAQEVGVAKSALYYHFESKEALYKELMEYSVKELKKEIKGALEEGYTSVDTVFNLIRTFLDYTLKHPEINLLTSLDVGTDEKLPIAQTIIDLRTDLIRFIRETIVSVDIVRRRTRKYTFLLARSLVGLVLNPLLPKDMNLTELSNHFMTLLFSQKAILEVKTK